MSEKDDKNNKAGTITLEDELQVYELGYHLLPMVKEEDLEKETAEIKKVIDKNGGLFIGEEGMPKIVKLSYEMVKIIGNKKNKFDTSYFGWMKFEATAGNILKIDNDIKEIENILRFILIKTVRESKIIISKRPISMRPRKEGTPEGASKGEKSEEKEKISEVEVDKAIEELVVE